MGKQSTDWVRFYDGIRVVRRPDSVYAPSATDAELDEVESQLESRLPHSYRQFMKRFGPGELQGWVRLNSITPLRNRTQFTLARFTNNLRKAFKKDSTSSLNHKWLSGLIYFATSFGGDAYAWDPADPTQSQLCEYRLYFLPRLREDQPVAAGDSFAEFLEWMVADIRSWREPEPGQEPGVYFEPAYLRAKNEPARRGQGKTGRTIK